MSNAGVTLTNTGPTITLVNDNVIITLAGVGAQGAPGQGVPTGGTTGQVLSKIDSTNYNTQWVNNSSATAWGNITGTLSNQTDLQSALNAKASLAGSNTFSGSMTLTDSFTMSGPSGTFIVYGGADSGTIDNIYIGGYAPSTGAFTTLTAHDLSVTDTITGSISGNAATATKLATARTIAITGDIAYTSPSFDGSANVTAAGTLATVNSNIGTFNSVTVNAKGLVTSASNVSYQAPITLTTTGTSGAATFSGNTLNIPQYAGASYTAGTGLTLSGGAFSVNTSQNISTLSNLTTNGFVKTSGSTGALSVDTNTYLTGNQTITLSGDITGSGATAITGTLATVNSNTGSFGSTTSIPTFTVNGKGLITAASTAAVVAPAGTLTGTTLASSITTSSLTSIGITSNGLLKTSGGAGALSIATAGTDYIAPFGSQTANYFYASPNGSSGTPSFRAIVAADIPTLNQNTTGTSANITATSNGTLTTLSALSLPYSQLSGTVPTWNQNTTGQAGTVATISGLITAGTNITITGSGTSGSPYSISASASGGTVTSVTFTGDGTILSSTPSSAVTTSGTVTATLKTQTANTVLAGPTTGSAANPTFRALVAADVPTLNQNTTGSAGSVAAANITGTTLASNVVTSSLTSVGTLTSLACSGAITDTQSMGVTSTDGLLLANTTNATSSAQQWSPRLHLQGQGWSTTNTNSQSCDWIAEVAPVSGAATPTSYLFIRYATGGGAYTNCLQLQGNNLTVGGTCTAANVAATANVTGVSFAATGRISTTYAGAASNAAITVAAIPYAAGTGTTNFPQWFANWGGTAVTNWSNGSNNGTVFGINAASTFTGNYFDFHNSSNTSTFTLTYAGNITAGTWQGSLVTGTYGGTGVNNGSSTITVGGNVTMSGAYTFTGTLTAATSVTFPTSGTLLTASSAAVTSAVAITGGTIDGVTIGGITPCQSQSYMPINTQSGTSYTTVLSDNGSYIRCTSSSAVTLTVPPNSSVAYPIGAEIVVMQAGSGKVTPTAGAGVTLNLPSGVTGSALQYAAFTCKKVATNTWDVLGNLA